MAAPLLVAGVGLQVASSLVGANSAKKAAKAQAEALRKRANEIRRRGEINAQAEIRQGELDQTSYAVNQASAGFRFNPTDFDSLNVLKDKASQQADYIRQEAAFEAETSMQEAGQYDKRAKSAMLEGTLNAASTIIGGYSKYKGYS